MENGKRLTRDEMKLKVAEMNGEEVVKFLQGKKNSDGYIIMRDMVTVDQKSEIKNSLPLKKVWKELEKELKEVWDYDHKMAMMWEVNAACTNVYTIVVRMIASMNESQTMMKDAINRLEEKAGIEITNWMAEPQQKSNDGVDSNENEQGDEKTND